MERGQNVFFNRNGSYHPRTSVEQKENESCIPPGGRKGGICPSAALRVQLTPIYSCSFASPWFIATCLKQIWNALARSVTGGQDVAAGLRWAESMKRRETNTWRRGRAGVRGRFTTCQRQRFEECPPAVSERNGKRGQTKQARSYFSGWWRTRIICCRLHIDDFTWKCSHICSFLVVNRSRWTLNPPTASLTVKTVS